jgi:DNA-binding HxlR family transcriptional regulator
MAGYRQYCPVARASEVMAERWTPLILRELLAGSRHFNDLKRGLPGISRSLLASRLRHLEDRGVVERRASGQSVDYLLTEAGEDFKEVIERLGAWGVRWSFGAPRAEELDPALLLWKIHQRIRRDRLPEGRTVLELDLTGRRGRRMWLVLQPHEVSLCLKPPGFDSDLIVRADLAVVYQLWLGQLDYRDGVRSGAIAVEGARALVAALPSWFMWSPMAPIVRAAARRARP